MPELATGLIPGLATGLSHGQTPPGKTPPGKIPPGQMANVGIDMLAVQPGRVTELVGAAGTGLTRLGLHLLAEPSRRHPVVALDVNGWLSPKAAWEVGIEPSRLIIVRCREPAVWVQLTAVLLEGVRVLYAEVPNGIKEHDLRRLTALARARKTGVVMRPLGERLPSGSAYLRLEATAVHWEGVVGGHGCLTRRHLQIDVSGKGVAGMTRRIEVIDDGTDVVRVVSAVGAHFSGTGRAAV